MHNQSYSLGRYTGAILEAKANMKNPTRENQPMYTLDLEHAVKSTFQVIHPDARRGPREPLLQNKVAAGKVFWFLIERTVVRSAADMQSPET